MILKHKGIRDNLWGKLLIWCVCEEPSRIGPIYKSGYTKPIMRSFKWHGIPVNLPSTKAEKVAIGVLLGFDVILCLVVGLVLVLK
jgi:hypothetical protein